MKFNKEFKTNIYKLKQYIKIEKSEILKLNTTQPVCNEKQEIL